MTARRKNEGIAGDETQGSSLLKDLRDMPRVQARPEFLTDLKDKLAMRGAGKGGPRENGTFLGRVMSGRTAVISGLFAAAVLIFVALRVFDSEESLRVLYKAVPEAAPSLGPAPAKMKEVEKEGHAPSRDASGVEMRERSGDPKQETAASPSPETGTDGGAHADREAPSSSAAKSGKDGGTTADENKAVPALEFRKEYTPADKIEARRPQKADGVLKDSAAGRDTSGVKLPAPR